MKMLGGVCMDIEISLATARGNNAARNFEVATSMIIYY